MSYPDRRSLIDLEGRPARALRFRSQRKFRLPCGALGLGVLLLLFWLIPPRQTQTDIAASLTESATRYVRPPTFTPPPKPTAVHGGRIVFTCTRGDYNQLCLINADGTGYQRLTNFNRHDYYPVFAPQGDAIVFASNRGGAFDLHMLLLSSGKRYQLTDGIGNAFSPNFSPDGKTIVFSNQAAEGPISLWLVGSNGRDTRLLFSSAEDIVAADWSPDGVNIAFVMAADQPQAHEVYLLDTRQPNQPPHKLTQGLIGITGSLDWSPDGKYLLLCAGPVNGKDIYRLDASTGETLQLTEGSNNAAASYSPDGQWIAFNKMQPDGQTDLYIMRADGSDERQLTDDPEPDWQPQWEP